MLVKLVVGDHADLAVSVVSIGHGLSDLAVVHGSTVSVVVDVPFKVLLVFDLPLLLYLKELLLAERPLFLIEHGAIPVGGSLNVQQVDIVLGLDGPTSQLLGNPDGRPTSLFGSEGYLVS